MRFDVLTLFPEIFGGYLQQSILNRAIQRGLIDARLWNIRDYTTDKHSKVDDKPFGGGPGMVSGRGDGGMCRGGAAGTDIVGCHGLQSGLRRGREGMYSSEGAAGEGIVAVVPGKDKLGRVVRRDGDDERSRGRDKAVRWVVRHVEL